MSRARLYIRQTFPGWWTDLAIGMLVGLKRRITVGAEVYGDLIATVIQADLIERRAEDALYGYASTTVMLGFDYEDDAVHPPTELEVSLTGPTVQPGGTMYVHTVDREGEGWRYVGQVDEGATDDWTNDADGDPGGPL